MKKQIKGLITGLVMMGMLSGCSNGAVSTTTAAGAATTTTAVTGGATTAAATGAATTTAPANRLEAIKARGVLSVVMEPAFAPYEFIDPSKSGDEKYVGSDVEMAKYIANKLGVKLQIVPLEFSGVLSSITDGKYDLAISALAYTPARAEAMILSDGYFFSEETPGYGLVIRSADAGAITSANDLADKVVVAQSGSLQELFANEQIPAKKELKRVSATNDGLLMVQEKKADAVVVEKAMAQLYIEANKNSGLQIVDGFEFTVDKATDGTRVGITNGEEELAAEVNKIIAELLASGQYEKWFKEAADYARSLGLQ